jgi:beta-1,4-N-acetylglucosaminyltransferase
MSDVMKEYRKLCLVASRGGHLQQLLNLSGVYGEYRHFIITAKTSEDRYVNLGREKVYCICDLSDGRASKNPIKFLLGLYQTAKIFAIEKPDLVLSTGAGDAIPSIILSFILRIPSVYIESYTRISALSKSGRICYYLASSFFVQHKKLSEKYSRAFYAGSLYNEI